MILAIPCRAIAWGAYTDAGKLSVENERGDVLDTYTVEGLMAEFSLHTRTTQTPWSRAGEEIGYRGPYLSDILKRRGLADHSAIQVVGYNNFITEISLDEIETYAPILAIEQQCSEADRDHGLCGADQEYRRISLRESGPMFIVWPLKELPRSYVPARNSIWVWFVVALRPAT